MLTRQRLAACNVQTQRRLRDLPSSDQKDDGDHLRVAGSEPRRVVVVVDLQVAGNNTDDELCDCRSSGEVKLVNVGLLEAQGQLLHGLRDEVNSLDMVAWLLVGRSIIGDELRRRRVRCCLLQSKQGRQQE